MTFGGSTSSASDGPTPTDLQNRPKACDLCFKKKIKCDMLKPKCSNCSLYNAECRTSTIRQRAARSRRKPPAPVREQVDEEGCDTLKARLDRIESLLQETVEQKNAAALSFNFMGDGDDEANKKKEQEMEWRFNPVRPTLYHGPSVDGTPLPPLHEILGTVDHYFNNFGRWTPLFDQSSFMRMLTNWYNHKATRNRVRWAAVLVVVALGSRSTLLTNGFEEDSEARMECIDYCLRNAQAVVPELVSRQEDLLGVQVLLALGVAFHQSCDVRAAGVYVGMALRLAHYLHLHSESSPDFFSTEDIQQRSRLFWIAYTLDKNISARTAVPAIQHDQDIDVPLPNMVPSDEAGLIWTKDRGSSFNYFRLRIDLSHIQGKIFDLIYSTRAQKAPRAERVSRIEGLQRVLSQWMSRIPAPFRLEHVATTVGEAELVQMAVLYHIYLESIVFLHGIYSKDAEWLKQINSLGKAAIQDYSSAVSGNNHDCVAQVREPPREVSWGHCVEISRACLKLFQEVEQSERLIWQLSCAHFTGLTILLANILLYPTHEFVSIDLQISGVGMQLLSDISDSVEGTGFVSLNQIITGLAENAKTAVEEARFTQAAENGDVFGTGQEEDWFPSNPIIQNNDIEDPFFILGDNYIL